MDKKGGSASVDTVYFTQQCPAITMAGPKAIEGKILVMIPGFYLLVLPAIRLYGSV
jgi:hypothetical protein